MRISLAEKELQRLISYTEGLGLNVVINPEYSHGDTPAQFIYSNPPTIELCINHRVNKVDIILALLHELGHYYDWLNTGKREPSDIFAKDDTQLSKTERKIVYYNEKKATILAISLAKKLNIRYPKIWRIKADAAYDRWFYRYLVNHDKQPSTKERMTKDKQLRDKYKALNNE